MNPSNPHFRSGDLVEVLTEPEIMRTLDASGALEGLPFTPEMRPFCGKRFRVYRRADKVCVEGPNFAVKRLRNAVSLDEVRCDGSAHDGCERLCMLFWKEAWLKPASPGEPDTPLAKSVPAHDSASHAISPEKLYNCQATSLHTATEPLSWWDLRQYWWDVESKAASPREVLTTLVLGFLSKLSWFFRGRAFGVMTGTQERTPVVALDLQPGDLVEVKSPDEIALTVDREGKNRGLAFSYEMLRYSGQRLRVKQRLERMILDDTGRMRPIRNTVLLENTGCRGLCVRGCARNSLPMWREAWLKRVPDTKPHVRTD